MTLTFIATLAVALFQVTPNAVMTPGSSNDRMTSEAFRLKPGLSLSALMAEESLASPTDLSVVGGAVRVTQGVDDAGRAAMLVIAVEGSGAREGWACRITEIAPDGENNETRALQWCRNVLGTAMIAVPRQ